MDIESIVNNNPEDIDLDDMSMNVSEFNWAPPSIIKPLFTVS